MNPDRPHRPVKRTTRVDVGVGRWLEVHELDVAVPISTSWTHRLEVHSDKALSPRGVCLTRDEAQRAAAALTARQDVPDTASPQPPRDRAPAADGARAPGIPRGRTTP